jgi:hypothetical protein
MIAAGLLALAALLAQALGECVALDQRPNPFEHGQAIPTIQEDPFDPTRTQLDLSRLPWALDPPSAWTASQRAHAAEPCGLWGVLQARYPLWTPPRPALPDPVELCRAHEAHPARERALRDAGWLSADPNDDGPVWLWPTPDALLLERGEGWEIALTAREGLQMRRSE